MTSLNDIKELLDRQGNDWRDANDKLIALVTESTKATTEANVLNRGLIEQLSGIKKSNLFDVLSQGVQIMFWLAITVVFVTAMITGRDIKFGDFQVLTPIEPTELNK